jgi:hypothetical protein
MAKRNQNETQLPVSKKVKTLALDESDLTMILTHPSAVCLRPVGRSCPYEVGERVQVLEPLWISDCGKYLAQSTKHLYDICTRDGSQWFTDCHHETSSPWHYWGNY